MKKVIALVLTAALCLTLFAGCSNGGGGGGDVGGEITLPKEGDTLKGRTLEVLYMVGGQGEMANPIADKLKEVYPDLTVNITYDHNAHEIMRNKVMSGNPPDIFDLNQGLYDYYGAIAEGVCYPFEPVLELPTVDGTQKLKDVVDLDMIVKGKVDGKHYCMADSVYTSGLYYDAKLFKDLGISVPTNWDEFMAACEKLKANNVYPLAYAGTFAFEYMLDYFFYPMVAAVDYQSYVDIQNLKEGAWKSDAVKTVLDRIQTMLDKGYFDPNSPGYEATSVQMEFIKRNVGFYPCGSWLEAEMAGNWPDDFELSYLPYSGAEKSDGDHYLIQAGVVSSISAKSQNLDIVGEWYRYFLSDPETTRKVIEVHINGLPLKDFSKNYGDLLPASVQQTWDALSAGSKPIVDLWGAWYKEAPVGFGDAINAFISGDISADDFMTRLDEQDTKIRNDSTLPKYTY